MDTLDMVQIICIAFLLISYICLVKSHVKLKDDVANMERQRRDLINDLIEIEARLDGWIDRIRSVTDSLHIDVPSGTADEQVRAADEQARAYNLLSPST